jgi:hypothetical protein
MNNLYWAGATFFRRKADAQKYIELKKEEFNLSYPFRIVECNFSTLKSLGF